jgi:hypothetical protein
MAHQQPEFAIVMRGYDREQVDSYTAAIAQLLDEAEQRLRNAEARAVEPDENVRLGTRLTAILTLADEEAAARRKAAQREAEELLDRSRRQAQEQAEAIVARAEQDSQRVRDEAEEHRLAQESATAVLEHRYAAVQTAISRLRETLVDNPDVPALREVG